MGDRHFVNARCLLAMVVVGQVHLNWQKLILRSCWPLTCWLEWPTRELPRLIVGSGGGRSGLSHRRLCLAASQACLQERSQLASWLARGRSHALVLGEELSGSV